MNGKKRAFFTSSKLAEPVKKIFNLNKNDEFITINENESLKPLEKAMKKSTNKKIFFIMVDDYEGVKNYLIQAGFKEFENFLDARMFLVGYDPEDFSFVLIEAL